MGGRGAHPPLPDQGARRAAADLPAVLRPLHPDGPRRQLHAGRRQAQVPREAGRPARRDDRLPAPHRRCATWWSPAATSRTCPGRGSRSSSTKLLEIENIRDIRLATKALMGLPQHWLQDDVRAGMERVATTARAGRVLAIHTHVNHANSVTPLVAKAPEGDARRRRPRRAQPGRAAERRQRRPAHLLDLCFALLDGAQIMPYYFYMCDMIPFSEHWRVSVAEAQRLQHRHHGLPARLRDAADRLRRAVRRQALGAPAREYDRERGISYWTKNYRTSIEATDPEALTRTYEYYDPIHTRWRRPRSAAASRRPPRRRPSSPSADSLRRHSEALRRQCSARGVTRAAATARVTPRRRSCDSVPADGVTSQRRTSDLSTGRG